MKKKIITITVAASVLLSGVVSAASIWGTYKGNEVIRVTSNGVTLKTPDVPAISYNGRTMIPLNMLNQLGFGYTWDQNNKTVNVIKEATDNKAALTQVNQIKTNVKYADFFHNLETVGETFEILDNYYTFAATSISSGSTGSLDTLKKINGFLNDSINGYNSIQKESLQYSDGDISYILNDYYTAIDYFKQMDVHINKYYNSKTSENFNNYLINKSKAHENYDAGRKLSARKYSDYIFYATK